MEQGKKIYRDTLTGSSTMTVILDLTWSQIFKFIQHIPVALQKLLLPPLSSYSKCLSGKRWSLLSDSTYIATKANLKGAEGIPLKAKLQNINEVT